MNFTEFKNYLDKYYVNTSSPNGKVVRCFYEFRWNRSIQNNENIHDVVLAVRRLIVHEIVEAIDESHNSMVSMLNDYLDKKKLWATSVPCLLTINHECNGVATSRRCLALSDRHSNEFPLYFTFLEETWINQNRPKTKRQLNRRRIRSSWDWEPTVIVTVFLRCMRCNPRLLLFII